MRIFASAAERTVALTFGIVCVQNRNTAEMKRTHCNFAFAAYNLDEIRSFTKIDRLRYKMVIVQMLENLNFMCAPYQHKKIRTGNPMKRIKKDLMDFFH